MEIKFCGFTNQTDVLEAVQMPIDYLGFIVAAKSSKRLISLEEGIRLAEVVKTESNKKTVAVVVDADTTMLEEIVNSGVFDVIQFHGQETPEICLSFKGKIEVWKAFNILDNSTEVIQKFARYKKVIDKVIFDLPKGDFANYDPKKRLETYQQISQTDVPIILAGGLNPQNIYQKILAYKPFGVDLSSGIEFTAGKKDPKKMKEFIIEVLRAQKELEKNGKIVEQVETKK